MKPNITVRQRAQAEPPKRPLRERCAATKPPALAIDHKKPIAADLAPEYRGSKRRDGESLPALLLEVADLVAPTPAETYSLRLGVAFASLLPEQTPSRLEFVFHGMAQDEKRPQAERDKARAARDALRRCFGGFRLARFAPALVASLRIVEERLAQEKAK